MCVCVGGGGVVCIAIVGGVGSSTVPQTNSQTVRQTDIPPSLFPSSPPTPTHQVLPQLHLDRPRDPPRLRRRRPVVHLLDLCKCVCVRGRHRNRESVNDQRKRDTGPRPTNQINHHHHHHQRQASKHLKPHKRASCQLPAACLACLDLLEVHRLGRVPQELKQLIPAPPPRGAGLGVGEDAVGEGDADLGGWFGVSGVGLSGLCEFFFGEG